VLNLFIIVSRQHSLGATQQRDVIDRLVARARLFHLVHASAPTDTNTPGAMRFRINADAHRLPPRGKVDLPRGSDISKRCVHKARNWPDRWGASRSPIGLPCRIARINSSQREPTNRFSALLFYGAEHRQPHNRCRRLARFLFRVTSGARCAVDTTADPQPGAVS
jgi:hypothetical protein